MSKFYFNMGKASDEITLASGVKETTLATAKLAGKALFNTGIFAGKLGIEIVKSAPEAMEKERERQLKAKEKTKK